MSSGAGRKRGRPKKSQNSAAVKKSKTGNCPANARLNASHSFSGTSNGTLDAFFGGSSSKPKSSGFSMEHTYGKPSLTLTPLREYETSEFESFTDRASHENFSKSTAGQFNQSARTMRIAAWNVNGFRACINKDGWADFLGDEERGCDADILFLSEVKCTLEQAEAKLAEKKQPSLKEAYPYIYWYESTEKKGYSGTALLSKIPPEKVVRGIGVVDGEGRCLTAHFPGLTVVHTYVPNSGSGLKFRAVREKWDAAMYQHLQELIDHDPSSAVVWTGDLNVARLNYDVYDGPSNKARQKSPGFTPYERAHFDQILNPEQLKGEEKGQDTPVKLVDVYRHFYPDLIEEAFTFFSFRAPVKGPSMKQQKRGWRLDYFLATENLLDSVTGIRHAQEYDGSDHVPIFLDLSRKVE